MYLCYKPLSTAPKNDNRWIIWYIQVQQLRIDIMALLKSHDTVVLKIHIRIFGDFMHSKLSFDQSLQQNNIMQSVAYMPVNMTSIYQKRTNDVMSENGPRPNAVPCSTWIPGSVSA